MKNNEELQEQKERINTHIKACWHRYAETKDGREIDRVFALEHTLATINTSLEIGWAGYKIWEALQKDQPASKPLTVLPKYLA
jgi:hypothetical protein